MVLIQPTEFGKFSEVTDVVKTSLVVTIRDDPADVGPEKPEQRGGVQVLLLIGKTMMVAMMGSPPQNPFLHGSHGHESDHKLKETAGLIGAMRKIAMITPGDEEHAHFVHREAGHRQVPVKWEGKYQKGYQMDQHEGQAAQGGDACTVR